MEPEIASPHHHERDGFESMVRWHGQQMTRRGFLGAIGKSAAAVATAMVGVFSFPVMAPNLREALACYFCQGCEAARCRYCYNRTYSHCSEQYWPVSDPSAWGWFGCGTGICYPEHGRPPACRACGITGEFPSACTCATIHCEWYCDQL